MWREAYFLQDHSDTGNYGKLCDAIDSTILWITWKVAHIFRKIGKTFIMVNFRSSEVQNLPLIPIISNT